MGRDAPYIMVVDTYHGGIGHKFISIYYILTYALILGRRLKSAFQFAYTHPQFKWIPFTGST